MNTGRIIAIGLILSLLPCNATLARGFGGGGFSRGGFGGGFSRGGFGGFNRSSFGGAHGGFDFHNDAAAAHPQGFSHSSTGPAGTSRSTNVSNTAGNYNRNTTASNGNYNRQSGGSVSANGNYSHYSNGSTGYGSHSSNTSGNYNTGNYSHNGSGSNPYGSYNTSGYGNTYNHTYSGSGSATNAWGQTYYGSTYASNGVIYHGSTVANPVYGGYAAWGWNGYYPWAPVPYYWGGGFWGPFAVGALTAAAWGSVVGPNNVTYTSYQVQPTSPGAKLLESYKLTQTPCGKPDLVVIYGPNKSVICAHPNDLVTAGNYSVNEKTLTLTSEKSTS